jgi:hypothetical protein
MLVVIASRLDNDVVLIPPPVPLGEAPITMATTINVSDAADKPLIEIVLKPAVEEAVII